MKKNFYNLLVILIGFIFFFGTNLNAQRQMEKLDRGVVAVKVTNGVFVSWRIFGTERTDVSYNIYRDGVKLNTSPITGASNYLDDAGTNSNVYQISTIVKGIEKEKSASVSVWGQNYLSIPLQIPANDTTPSGEAYTYSANDCSVGDLDGDGKYEIIVKWDPSNSKDNSQSGYTGPVILDAYKLDGTRLWRINLGINIRAGAHYTQFMVFDLDGDGKAEIACKTADGTIDGKGTIIGNASADYRNTSGYILSGPEYLTIFNGQTGAAMATVNYDPPRGTVSDWGDSYGNRVDRFLAGIAYLDGSRPSLVMCRGYYTRAYLAAYDWKNGTLTERWTFDSNVSGNSGYAGQGTHSLSIGDVDNDGKDEIIYGACTIDHDGTGKYTTGLGHGDALHLSDFDPDRPGLEVWQAHEDCATNGGVGASFRDANTGAIIFKYATTSGDVGRGMAGDLDANYKGAECWAAGTSLYTCKGATITPTPNSDNFRIYWDGDDQDELLDGTTIYKYNVGSLLSASGCSSNNGTKSTPNLSADIFGDWREEAIWRTSDNAYLRIYTTTILTNRRMYTLMHDKSYRLAVAWQNVAYNQPPHLSFYLAGDANVVPPTPINAENYIWKGNVAANTWDISSNNWIKDVTTTSYNDGDSVLFDFTGINSVPVTINNDLRPGFVSVFSTTDYAFNGSGKLTGDMMLVKSGSGKLILNNNNSYSGITDIWDGSLIVNDTLYNSPVVVHGGVFSGVKTEGKEGGRVGGSGIIKGGVILANKGGVTPGNDINSPDTLTIENNLIEKGIAFNLIDLSDDPTGLTKANDFINVIGNISFSDSVYFVINKLNSGLSGGEYILFHYTGTFTGTLSKITVLGIPGISYTIENKNNTIVLVVAAIRPPTTITWTGSVNNIWDFATTANWQKGEVPDIFVTGDTATFTDNYPAYTSIVISGTSPYIGGIIVDGSNDFSFSGSGSLIGNGGIVKSGSGKLTINNTHSFTGGASFTGGNLEIATLANADAASSIGAGAVASSDFVLNDIAVKYTGSSSSTDRGITLAGDTVSMEVPSGKTIGVSGIITGTGKLQKTGAGTLTLSGMNTFTGGTILRAGILQPGEYGSAETKAFGSGTITLEGGTIAMTNGTGTSSSSIASWNMVVPEGASASLLADGRCEFKGSLTGSGTLGVYVPYVRSIFSGNWSAFTGTLNLTTDADGGDFRMNNANGYANIAFNLGSGVSLFYMIGSSTDNGAQSVSIGALSGVSGSYLTSENWTIGAKNLNTTFAGIISGNSVTKVGTGTLTLSNANTYSGGTIISGGAIIASNTTGSATGTGSVTINNGGVLIGTGIISGAITVNNGGTIAAGNLFGSLTVNNNVTFLAGSKMATDINNSSGVSDKLFVTGTYKLILDGTLDITNTSTSPFIAGNSFTIMNCSAISGSFKSINPSVPGAGLVWDTTMLRSNGIIKVIADPALSIPGIIVDPDVKVYPSPTNGMITLQLSDLVKNISIKVINSYGIQVYAIKNKLINKLGIDLSSLPNDVYILQINMDGTIITKKVIKE
jgi:autotransporter-associated beta strand protein